MTNLPITFLNLQTELKESQRAKRPIVEFVPGTQLYNHGDTGQGVDFVDTTTTDALSDLQGAIGLSIDQVAVTEGSTIGFTADPAERNKIFTVSVIVIKILKRFYTRNNIFYSVQ